MKVKGEGEDEESKDGHLLQVLNFQLDVLVLLIHKLFVELRVLVLLRLVGWLLSLGKSLSDLLQLVLLLHNRLLSAGELLERKPVFPHFTVVVAMPRELEVGQTQAVLVGHLSSTLLLFNCLGS